MTILIDGNLSYLARRINVSTEEMFSKYATSTIDNIIKQEVCEGNNKALSAVNEIYGSPDKIIELYQLANTENKYNFLNSIDVDKRLLLFPLLEKEDLVMGLHFFTQEKILDFMMKTDIEELVNVILEAFPVKEILKMFKQEDLQKFFLSNDLKNEDVIEQMKNLPYEVMEIFIEQLTGQPMYQVNPEDIIKQIENLPDKEYKDLLTMLDPRIQLQLVFQLTDKDPEYYQLFDNKCYVEMLTALLKPDLVKSMIALKKETLVSFMDELTPALMSVVLTQIDTTKFARVLSDSNNDLLKKALIR